jgi:hypothetical protein
MFGADHTVRGQKAIFDVGEHGVRPAEGRVPCGRAIGAGYVALVDDARLLGNAAKPLAAVADDCGSGRDAGAQSLGFAGLKPAHDLQAGVQRSAVSGSLDRNDKGCVAASAAPGAFAGALAADVGVVDLDPWAGGAQLVTAVALRSFACISLC